MSIQNPAAPSRNDRGLTLIELIVASGLLVLVMSVIGGIFMSLFSTERTVTTVTQGTNAAQLAATSIGDRIRNSSEFAITDVGQDQLLVARVAGSANAISWTCHAWYYSDAGDGALYTTQTAATRITPPSSTDLLGWTLLVEGISPHDGGDLFSDDGSRLEVEFEVAAGTSPPILISFTAVALTGVEEGTSCF